MTSLSHAARAFAEQGWPTFPVTPGGKTPAIASAHPDGDPLRGVCRGECGADGHGLHDASTDPEKVGAWWTAMPRANIGVRTGVVCDVLDVDGPTGCSGLVGLLDVHGCLPSGPSSATPSGGVHLFFAPTGLSNAAGFVPSLDWRGDGGYVVVPPSSRPEGIYEWGLRPSEFPLPPAPAWLVALHPQSRRSSLSVGGAGGNRSVTTAGAYGRRALEAEVGRLSMAPVGDRNHQLNRSAFSLGQLVAGGVLDAAEVVEALVMAAHRIGLDSRETENAIRSGLGDGMRQPRRART